MANHQMQTFALKPHLPAPMRCSITGQVTRVAGGLLVSYCLEADLKRLRIAPPTMPRFTDELWRHTCFELFVGRQGEMPYLEFNFSPSGQWAVYAFTRYRERMPLETLVGEAGAPEVTVKQSAHALQLSAVARLGGWSPAGQFRVGISAVLENIEGALSYWALEHPGPQPDFHHPDAWVLELR